MDTTLLLARLVLAAVFAVSGIAKLADPPGSRRALAGFGLSSRLVAPGAIVLPLVELATAVLLLPRATAWWGALSALALLLAFVAGIGYNLSKGRTPDCYCFGKLHSEPAGWPTLARNVALAAVAGFVVAGGWSDRGYSTIAWLGDLSTGEPVGVVLGAIAVVAVAIEGWLLIHLRRQIGRLLVRLDMVEEQVQPHTGTSAAPAGLPEGTPAPAFRLDGVYGETMTLDALRSSGTSVLLVFTDPACRPCNALMPELGRWQREYTNQLAIAVIGRGTAEANRAQAVEHGLINLLLQRDREVADAYRAKGTPSAVLVHDDGTIGSPVVTGTEEIRRLVTRTTRIPVPISGTVPGTGPGRAHGAGIVAVDDATARNGAAIGTKAVATQPSPPIAEQSSRIGTPAPEVALPDLSGTSIRLSDFRGSPTLVLFWNPSCGYCQRMTDDLKAWEVDPPAGAPRVLVVSTGTVEANEAIGLRSTVVLDQTFAAGRAFGATATPSAVLMDAHGMIASDVFVGASRVLALANGQDPQTLVVDAPLAPERPAIPAGTEVKKGDPAPLVRLNDLDGRRFDLAKHNTWPLALLFWDPSCGFCRQMVDRLKEWEERVPGSAPQLILVSEGAVEVNREFGLRSRILLDDELSIRRAYGAAGTPSAVLISAERRVASDLVAGGRAVLDLLGFVPAACTECVEECRRQGGGDACRAVCQMGGKCP